MKQAHEKKTKMNLLIPVNPTSIVSEEQTDCFGKEFFPTSKECSICSDCEICSILYQKIIKNKVKTIEAEHGPFLDQVDFKTINWDRFIKKAIEYEDSGEPMTFQELFDAIKTLAKTKDGVAVTEFIKRNLPLSKLCIKEGNIYAIR